MAKKKTVNTQEAEAEGALVALSSAYVANNMRFTSRGVVNKPDCKDGDVNHHGHMNFWTTPEMYATCAKAVIDKQEAARIKAENEAALVLRLGEIGWLDETYDRETRSYKGDYSYYDGKIRITVARFLELLDKAGL